MQKDYSEYVPTEQEQYQLRRRGNEFIDFEYFNNRAKFNPEHRTLDIQVDGKKESLWMDELVEEYESAREERGGEEFLGLDEDGTEEEWQDNEEDVSRLDKRYRVSYFPFEDLIKSDQFTETFGIAPRNVPMNNVLSGTDVHLKYGEGLLDCQRHFKMSIFAEMECHFLLGSIQVLYSLIHNITCRLEARQALIYQLVLGLTGKNGKYNYSKAVHLTRHFSTFSVRRKTTKPHRR